MAAAGRDRFSPQTWAVLDRGHLLAMHSVRIDDLMEVADDSHRGHLRDPVKWLSSNLGKCRRKHLLLKYFRCLHVWDGRRAWDLGNSAAHRWVATASPLTATGVPGFADPVAPASAH